jgi:hypothetical protein
LLRPVKCRNVSGAWLAGRGIFKYFRTIWKEIAMPVMTPERAEEIIVGWRRGIDEEGLESPAGPLFVGGYAESEITMTGGGHTPLTASATCPSAIVITEPLCPPCC